MHEKRIQNILLGIVAALLLLNLGVMLAPVAHAVPATQYKAARVLDSGNLAATYQRTLDQHSAQGWEFVDADGGTLIFKR